MKNKKQIIEELLTILADAGVRFRDIEYHKDEDRQIQILNKMIRELVA